MTISTAVRKAGPYVGDGATREYAFTFKVFADSDVKVVVSDASGNERTMAETTEYRVQSNTDQRNSPGGSIILNTPLPTGARLSIISKMQFVQPVEFTNQGGFYPRVLNDALDRLTMYTQQLDELLSRAVVLSVNQDSTYVAFPVAVAGNLLAWNTKGELENFDLHTLLDDSIEQDDGNKIASSKAVKSLKELLETIKTDLETSIENNENAINTEKLRLDGMLGKISALTGGVDLSSFLTIAELTTQDLNTLSEKTHYGVYAQMQDDQATTEHHYPIQQGGTLFIVPSAHDVQQIYFPREATDYYKRNKTDTGWTDWRTPATDAQARFAAQDANLKRIKLLALAGL